MAIPKDLKDLPADIFDHIEPMPLFGSNIELTISGERVPLAEFSFAFATPKEFDSGEMLTAYTTTNQVLEADLEMTPEQEAEAERWWTEFAEKQWRRLMGLPESEYTESLRAAGAKV
jgi:hypothetical protein